MQERTQEIINYFRNERARVRQWYRAQSRRVAITLVGLALLAQAVLWVGIGYYNASLMLLVAALGVYVFTSLRWVRNNDCWTIMLQSIFFLMGMLGMVLVLYVASIHPARTMSELTDGEIIRMSGAAFASVVIFLISFVESKAGTWLHARIPIVVMVGSGILLGPEWMWLGLLFPAVVLILVRLARYVIFLFRLFIGNPVLNLVHIDRHR